MIVNLQAKGYGIDEARARICQDIILNAISSSTLSKNMTIKGGVVMRSITNDLRRTTQDVDIDFIHYSLSDNSIEYFIRKLNCIEGITISRIGRIDELSQQDYNGKRVYIRITDKYNNIIESKMDLGVHKYVEIEQEEYCFDIAFNDEGASLLINTKEQMFVEKLRSLLKFGVFSTRYKDIYDMYYLCDKIDMKKLYDCIYIFIIKDLGMREDSIDRIIKRVDKIFKNNVYKNRVDKSDKRWLDDNIEDIFKRILECLSTMGE